MKSRSFTRLAPTLALSLVLATTGAAHALPGSMSITYTTFVNNQSNHRSPFFVYTFDVTPVQQDGDAIAWQITNMNILSVPSELSWSSVPTVDTGDGLWWVTHADPNSPQAAEFVLPHIYGTGVEDNEAASDVNYDLTGSLSGGTTPQILLTRTVIYSDTDEPIDEGDDDAVQAGVQE